MFRRLLALLLGISLVMSVGLTTSHGLVAVAAARAVIVLDPDDNLGQVDWPGEGHLGELPFNYRLATEVKKLLEHDCRAKVVLTRDDSVDFVPLADRKAVALNAAPDLMATLAFNTLVGFPWGVESDGGPRSFARSQDTAFAQGFLDEISADTGRPATAGVGPLVYGAYADLPFPYAHVEALFLDHNYDHPVIRDRFDLVVQGVYEGLADQVEAKGFKCDPRPARPSAAELQRLRNLGYQNFLRYGADPVSMSTGNFVTSEELLKLSGVGSEVIDATITYNAQSGLDSQFGFGWTFAYGASSQEYADDSVAVSLGDGRTFLFEADGNGYKSAPGAFATLSRVDGGVRWSGATGESSTFAVDDATGRGHLVNQTDRQGNQLTLAYDGQGTFPRLTSITDQAGQVVAVTTDDNGRITSLKRPDGAIWTINYSVNGNLESITLPGGKTRRFGYDLHHRMTAEIGADGVKYLTNTYDGKSRVVAQTNSFGDQRKLVYDDDKQTTTYTDLNGKTSVYHWDDAGRVTKLVDGHGDATATDYDADSQPSKVTDDLGRTTTTKYDASGQVSKVTDPEGNSTSSAYNDHGDLTSTTDQGGTDGDDRATTYHVNDQGLPTLTTNPDGSTTAKAYDAHGDLTVMTDELGRTTTMAYDDRGNVTSTTDPNGHASSQTFDLANRLTAATDALGNKTIYTYDADDNLLSTTYPNNSSETSVYDANDQVVKLTDRRGAVTTYAYDTELNLIATTLPKGGMVKNSFDKENRLVKTTDARGGTTTYTLDELGRTVATSDANGHRTSKVLNAAGEVTKETDPTGAATTYKHDDRGLVTTKTTPNRGVTRYRYDQVGRLVSTTDARDHVKTTGYNWRDQPTVQTDPAGGAVTQNYDAAGQLKSRTDESGATTSYSYDGAGNLIKTTDAEGGVTTNTYDVANRLIQVTDPNGHVDKRLSYDPMGQVTTEEDALGRKTSRTYDPGGSLTSETNGAGNKTSYSYDASGQRTTTTDPLGRITKESYSLTGLRTGMVKPSGVATSYGYDLAGNLTAVVENAQPGQTATASRNVITRYTYTERNQLATIVDAVKAKTRFGYDEMGQLIKEVNPLGQKTTYDYDLVGNRTQRIAGNGTITEYTYDAKDQAVRRTYNKKTKEYLDYTPTGLLGRAENGTGVVATKYDKLQRPTHLTDASGGQTVLEYDKAGNRTRMTLPGSRVTDYHYDAADQLISQDSPLGTVGYSYDGAGRPLTTTRPNGTVTTQTYDAAGQLSSKRTTKGASPIASFDYTYTADAYVASRNQTIDGKTDNRSYTYDPLGRLIKSSGGPVPSDYTYDAVGNRIKYATVDDPSNEIVRDAISQTNAYNKADQLTKSTTKRTVGKKHYTDVSTNSYDGSGNLTLSKMKAKTPGLSLTRAYKYTSENLLAAAGPATKYKNVCGVPLVNNKGCPSWLNKNPNTGNSGRSNRPNTLRREYDALGRLVYEYNVKDATTWTHDGLDPVLSTTSSGSTQHLRDGTEELVGDQATNGEPRWYVSDMLGSLAGRTDTTGAVGGKVINYGDYGTQLADSTFAFSFTRHHLDTAGTGLLHAYARSLLVQSGGWLQADPNPGSPMNPASLARYGYVEQDPTSQLDVLGYYAQEPLSVARNSYAYGLVNFGTAGWPINLPSSGYRFYVPPKDGLGLPVKTNSSPYGYRDAWGNIWQWTNRDSAHGGPHWDVQHPNGTHTNVDSNGNVRGGEKNDNFPNSRNRGYTPNPKKDDDTKGKSKGGGGGSDSGGGGCGGELAAAGTAILASCNLNFYFFPWDTSIPEIAPAPAPAPTPQFRFFVPRLLFV